MRFKKLLSLCLGLLVMSVQADGGQSFFYWWFFGKEGHQTEQERCYTVCRQILTGVCAVAGVFLFRHCLVNGKFGGEFRGENNAEISATNGVRYIRSARQNALECSMYAACNAIALQKLREDGIENPTADQVESILSSAWDGKIAWGGLIQRFKETLVRLKSSDSTFENNYEDQHDLYAGGIDKVFRQMVADGLTPKFKEELDLVTYDHVSNDDSNFGLLDGISVDTTIERNAIRRCVRLNRPYYALINPGYHWTCMRVYPGAAGKVEFMDSMNGTASAFAHTVLNRIRQKMIS